MPDDFDLKITYRVIVAAAKNREFLTYKDVVGAHDREWDWPKNPVFGHLGEISKLSVERLEGPMLSAIVVSESNLSTGHMSEAALKGFIGAAKEIEWPTGCSHDLDNQKTHLSFMKAQQSAVFEWASNAPDDLRFPQQRGEGVPAITRRRFHRPIIDALREADGTAPSHEVIERVKKLAKITPEEIDVTLQSGQSKVTNYIHWAKRDLVQAELIVPYDRDNHGQWELTAKGWITHLNQDDDLVIPPPPHGRLRPTHRLATMDARNTESTISWATVALWTKTNSRTCLPGSTTRRT